MWDDRGQLLIYANESITQSVDLRDQRIQVIISVVITPIIAIIGLIGNTINVIIFHHPQMRHNTYRILLAVAIADTIVLLHAVVFFFLDLTLLTNPQRANHLAAILVPITMAYTGHVALGASTWLNVFAVFKRWTDIYCPLYVLSGSKWTRKRITTIIGLIISITSLLYAPMAFQFDSVHSENHTKCIVSHFHITNHDNYFYWYFGMFLIAAFHVIPIIVIVALNVVIVQIMRRLWVLKLRRNSTMKSTYLSIASYEQTRVTILLCIVTSLTAICAFPGVVHFLYYRLEQHHTYIEDRNNMFLASNRLVMLPEYFKSAVTSFVYIAVSPRYKHTCSRVFCCSRNGDPQDSFRDVLTQMYAFNSKVKMGTVEDISEPSSSRHIYELSQLEQICRYVPSMSLNPWQKMAIGLTRDMMKATGKSESNIQFITQRPIPYSWWHAPSEKTSTSFSYPG